jgi:hypothetical protein
MFGKLQIIFVLIAAFCVTGLLAQKTEKVKPPPETASLAETQQWLTTGLAKYASYKTRTSAVTTSNVRFDGCTLTLTQSRKSGTVSMATMGATRTTSTLKDDLSINLAHIGSSNIAIVDHVYPELQTLEIRVADPAIKEAGDVRLIELVVEHEASDAIKAALLQANRLCISKN